jgi:hypothetical protein
MFTKFDCDGGNERRSPVGRRVAGKPATEQHASQVRRERTRWERAETELPLESPHRND